VAEPTPNPDLLRSLGHLVRGLSALFWGLPLTLVLCILTANGDWPSALGVLPAFAATALLFYGLNLLGHFQSQERIWNKALDRARIFALLNVGLSPFLFWWSQLHSEGLFMAMVEVMMLSGLAFLLMLNPVLWRLSAMLPDETLRLETKFFTSINRYLLLFDMAVLLGFLLLRILLERKYPGVSQLYSHYTQVLENILPGFNQFYSRYEPAAALIPLLFILAPVAITMALIWKVKEVIMSSVFNSAD
jgi:hypothetical protein